MPPKNTRIYLKNAEYVVSVNEYLNCLFSLFFEFQEIQLLKFGPLTLISSYNIDCAGAKATLRVNSSLAAI